MRPHETFLADRLRALNDVLPVPAGLQYWEGLKFMDRDIVRTVVMSFWLLAEPIRIAAGWYGNLQENVSTSTQL